MRESCASPWTAQLKEIKAAIIKKVEYRLQPETGLKELLLDVETTEQQHFVIHVSPEYKTSRCPGLFRFQEGEAITVVGSELLTAGNQENICAAEIIRQDGELLELRDRTTGKYNNDVFKHKICKSKLPPSIYSCGKWWKTPLSEIEGTIRKIEYRKPPGGSQAGLHFDVKTTDQQNVVIHVFPERKIKQCPDLFRFQEGETVTVTGVGFSTPNHQENICVVEIIRQDGEPLKLKEQDPEMLQPKVLKLRDPITGNHNNDVFDNKKCINEDELKSSSLFNWIKNYIGAICKECGDEIVAWDSSAGLLEKCNKCTNKLGWILRAYTGDCTKCQEIERKNSELEILNWEH
ncbi:MAG: hypothetical protein D3909_19365, partial [Candidatus Electrothrix sp. ATG1]|nr:hypothetical protein [Candidatus Electrothrix sp. ATG1]